MRKPGYSGARPRQSARPRPLWRAILLPVGQWLMLAAVFAVLAMLIAGEARPPVVVKQRDALDSGWGSNGPFSLGALHKRLPPEAVGRIQHFIEFFQTRQRQRVIQGLSRSTRYLSTYKRLFAKQGMPQELAYLPLIESGFVATAVSPANAAGMWQFIEETGRRYNLQRTDWSDKRLDPFKSARAAAAYLKNLHQRFGNWELALAAYNSGEGTVSWAMRKNRKAGRPTHYWALDLPGETQGYVPAFIAAVLIAKNPSAFGFSEIRFQPKFAFEQIKVSPGISLHFVAEQIGVSGDTLLEYNPHLFRGSVPPGIGPQLLRIPSGMRNGVPERLTGLTASLRDWMLHRVQHSDTLELLGARFSAKPSHIKQLNRIENNADLTQRQAVIIPL